ncbi:MAG: hypothetical protein KAR19_05835 [Bacteroidales bacterium]|nr:hypothetical protein [Bacteroidales bacterium]
MNTIKSYRYLLLTLLLLLAGSVVMAQDEEGERERQKAMQAKEMKMRKEMLEEQKEKMEDMERQHADQVRIIERQAHESSRARSPVRSSRAYPEGNYLLGPYGQGNQSQLTLRKTFRETTSTSKGEFEVEPDIRHFRCMISGSVRSGEIFIGIEYPNGKTFKELVINSSADINFSQSVSIKEGEEKKYTGTWNYVIKADKAEGNYMVQIQTN